MCRGELGEEDLMDMEATMAATMGDMGGMGGGAHLMDTTAPSPAPSATPRSGQP